MAINDLVCKVSELTHKRKHEILLLVRITLAVVFIQAGWGKLMNFERTVGFFASIGLPMPAVNAALASVTEFVGGILVLLGLFTRYVTLPLAFVMVVALLTAHLGDIGSISDLVSLPAWNYLMFFLLLGAVGAGKWSLDKKFCPSDKCCSKDKA